MEGFPDYDYEFDGEKFWKLRFKGVQIGEFEYMEENGKYWLNGCAIDDPHKGKHLGKEMIRLAKEEYGAVYFCRTSKDILMQLSGDYDARYLTPEGIKFCESCIKHRIIQPEWWCHPYPEAMERDRPDYKEHYL